MFIACQEKYEPSANVHYDNFSRMELSLKERTVLQDRLRQEMKRRGIEHQKDFAALLGITPTFLSQIFGGSRGGVRQVINFARRLKVPVGYLLGLEKLPEWLADFYGVPLVEGRIAANPSGRIPGEAVETLIWMPRSHLGGRRDLIAVRLAPDADSMEPNLHPGDLVIIDRDDRTLTPRGLFAVRLPDLESCAVKRLQIVPDQDFILLLSDNPNYDPVPVLRHDHLIIGRVICSWTYWVK